MISCLPDRDFLRSPRLHRTHSHSLARHEIYLASARCSSILHDGYGMKIYYSGGKCKGMTRKWED